MVEQIAEIINKQIWSSDKERLLALYRTKQNEGCTHVAVGNGRAYTNARKLVNDPIFKELFSQYSPIDVKIVDLLAFYGKGDHIQTCEFPKIHESTEGMGMHLQSFEREYTPRQFEEHLKVYQVCMNDRTSLENLGLTL